MSEAETDVCELWGRNDGGQGNLPKLFWLDSEFSVQAATCSREYIWTSIDNVRLQLHRLTTRGLPAPLQPRHLGRAEKHRHVPVGVTSVRSRAIMLLSCVSASPSLPPSSGADWGVNGPSATFVANMSKNPVGMTSITSR